MAIQFSVAVRNARLDAIETAIGTSPKLRIYSGAPPASCAAARTGTLLAEIALPSDWAAAASGGSKSYSGLPLSVAASAAGVAAHYAVMDSAGTTCHEQGSVGTSSADMIIDNTSIAAGQNVQITSWSKTEGGA